MSSLNIPGWRGFVIKKAFNTQTKDSWKKRFVEFKGDSFEMTWADNEAKSVNPKGTFKLDPADLTYAKSDDHKRPFEMRVTSRGLNFYFCPESEAACDEFLARIDAARRLKVASVEADGKIFKSEHQLALESQQPVAIEDGYKVYTWGVGLLLGIGKLDINGTSIPQRVSVIKPEKSPLALCPGPEHAAVITSETSQTNPKFGSAFMWGSNEFNQLAQPKEIPCAPRPLSVIRLNSHNVQSLSCGGSHTLAVVSQDLSNVGTIYAWGTGTVGQLGLTNATQILDSPVPVHLPTDNSTSYQGVSQVFAGLVTSAAITDTGACYVWGDASAGRLGLPNIPEPPMVNGAPVFVNGHVVWTPTLLDINYRSLQLTGDNKIVSVCLGGAFTVYLVWTGTGKGCVPLVSGALGHDITRDPYGYPPTSDTEVDALVDEEMRRIPRFATPQTVAPFGVNPVVLYATAGARHAAIIAADPQSGDAPRLYTAGKGWLGHAGTVDSILIQRPNVSPSFAKVDGALANVDVISAACGHSHTLALANDGRAFAWGRGDSGELGYGNLSDRSMPKECKSPGPGQVWNAIGAGSYYSLASAMNAPSKVAPGSEFVTSCTKKWAEIADNQEKAKQALLEKELETQKTVENTQKESEAPANDSAMTDEEIEALAREKATALWDEGAGELPPDWDYETTDEGEIYYVQPDGETTWDDPRITFDLYVSHFISAAKERGFDLNTL